MTHPTPRTAAGRATVEAHWKLVDLRDEIVAIEAEAIALAKGDGPSASADAEGAASPAALERLVKAADGLPWWTRRFGDGYHVEVQFGKGDVDPKTFERNPVPIHVALYGTADDITATFPHLPSMDWLGQLPKYCRVDVQAEGKE